MQHEDDTVETRQARRGWTRMSDLGDAMQAMATGLASVQATVAGMATSIQEIKVMLSSYVRNDLYESEMQEVKARVAANETRSTSYATVDMLREHVKTADERYGELADLVKQAPDVKRQNQGLWLSLGALVLSTLCGLVYVLTDIVTFLQHITLH